MTDENVPSDSGATAADATPTESRPAPAHAAEPAAQPQPVDPDAIRADIERTRSELSDTVNQLSDKLNVKSQAADKLTAAKQAVSERAAKAKAAAPPPVQHALDQAGAKAGPAARQVSQKAEPHRSKIIAGAIVGVLVLLILRRRKGGDGA